MIVLELTIQQFKRLADLFIEDVSRLQNNQTSADDSRLLELLSRVWRNYEKGES